jgi:DNA-directed RNA polymerase subunit M/transcription elongation factor TFIIS
VSKASFRPAALIVHCPNCNAAMTWLTDTNFACYNEDCSDCGKEKELEAPTIEVNLK